MPFKNNLRNWRGRWFVVVLIALAGFVYWSRQPAKPVVAKVASPSNLPPPSTAVVFTNDPMLQAAFTGLQSAASSPASRPSLEVLRAQLAALPRAEAVAIITKFLDDKSDTDTQLGFKIAANGSLSAAPTFRTFLLDELARIDPQAAAEYARTILARMDSPDEWALALRNLALGDPHDAARALVAEKFSQLLAADAWQKNPSVGYLEAFDVAVFLGDKKFVPPLSGLLAQKDNPAVAHAAYLALDRMVINNAAQTLAALADNPELMKGRENTRADYFARADVRDEAQRKLLENYLLNPKLGAAELQQFIGTYPNANFMISPNLLTANSTPDHATLANRDKISLQVLDEWLADPRFAALRPKLETARQRVQGFVTQAGGHP